MIPTELMQHTIRPAEAAPSTLDCFVDSLAACVLDFNAHRDADPQDAATQAVQRAAPYLTRHAAAYIAAAAVAAYRRAPAA